MMYDLQHTSNEIIYINVKWSHLYSIRELMYIVN